MTPRGSKADDPIESLVDSLRTEISSLVDEIRKSNDKGAQTDDSFILLPRWTLTIIGTVVAAALIGLTSFVFQVSSSQAVMVEQVENIIERRLQSLDQALRDHTEDNDERLDALERRTDRGG